MPELNIFCLHFDECNLLPQITDVLQGILALPIKPEKVDPDLQMYYNPERSQYDAAGILAGFEDENSKEKTILLTSLDLYIPIFTFVFGLAKLNGATGIVSAHRLKNEFYGLPPDEKLLAERVIKEVVHELGHLLNLRHCINYQCVMASSNTADDLDVKGDQFCLSCLELLKSG